MKITAVLYVLSLWAAGTTIAHPLSGVSSASDGNVKQIFARDDIQKCGDRACSPVRTVFYFCPGVYAADNS